MNTGAVPLGLLFFFPSFLSSRCAQGELEHEIVHLQETLDVTIIRLSCFGPFFFYKKELDSCARLLTSSEIDVYFLCSGISMYLPGRA